MRIPPAEKSRPMLASMVAAVAVALALLTGAFSGSAEADPLFAAPFLSFETGRGPQSVAIGDLNGDGKPDLAVANSHSWSVSVLAGNGDGTFETYTDFGIGSNQNSVAIGDLNGDGKLDLVVASGSVSVLLGNGDGTFGAQTDFVNGSSSPSSVVIGDLNGDGKLDVVASPHYAGDYSSSPSAVSVLLGNGDGTLGGKDQRLWYGERP